MKGSRFSQEQIIGILREAEGGLKTAEVCRRHGIAEATPYKWKAKYGGMEVADAKRLRGLEDESRRLKKLLAEAMVDNVVLKDILAKTAEACGAASDGDAALRSARPEPTARLQAGCGSIIRCCAIGATCRMLALSRRTLCRITCT
jgi:putative transposase